MKTLILALALTLTAGIAEARDLQCANADSRDNPFGYEAVFYGASQGSTPRAGQLYRRRNGEETQVSSFTCERATEEATSPDDLALFGNCFENPGFHSGLSLVLQAGGRDGRIEALVLDNEQSEQDAVLVGRLLCQE